MNKSLVNINDEKEEYIKFITNFRSLELSTIGKYGQPETSYAPYVSDENKNLPEPIAKKWK